MSTHFDELSGTYYVVPDSTEKEDKAMLDGVAEEINEQFQYTVLRPYYSRLNRLTADQRSRIAYYDDLLKRL